MLYSLIIFFTAELPFCSKIFRKYTPCDNDEMSTSVLIAEILPVRSFSQTMLYSSNPEAFPACVITNDLLAGFGKTEKLEL